MRFETKFLNDYFTKLLGKESFTMTDLKRLKNIVVSGNKEKITQHDFDILQNLEDSIEIEEINMNELYITYITIRFNETESDEIEDENIDKINHMSINRLHFPY